MLHVEFHACLSMLAPKPDLGLRLKPVGVIPGLAPNFNVLSALVGSGRALEGPSGVTRGLRAPLEALGKEHLGDHLGALGRRAMILGGFVITWGGSCVACGSRGGQGPTAFTDTNPW